MADAISMKNQFLAQVAQIDNQIMTLKDQMTETLQKAVDLDIKTDGSISDITRQFIETFHFKINEDGMVCSEYINYGQAHVKEQRENKPEIQEKKVITQAQLNSMIAEHREKQAVGNCEILDLSDCVFDNVTFTGNYNEVSFMNSEMERCSFKDFEAENVIFSRADFSNATFDNCIINNSMLLHANMGFSEIVNTAYTNCSFQEASLVGSNFQESEFSGCDLNNAVISDTHFLNVIANGCTGTETINFSTYSRDQDRYRAEFANTFITPDVTIEHKVLLQNEVSINISAQNGEDIQNVVKKEKPAGQPAASKENTPKGQNKRPAYASYVYVRGKEAMKSVCVTGISPEKIIVLCQNWNKERSADNQLGVAYMQKYNPQTREYDHIGKFDVKTGNDITPIYLKKLTNLNDEQFRKTTEMFKNNGAKFNSRQKVWYITKQQLGMPVFKDYLPNQDEKTNVHDSLDRNKNRLENPKTQSQHEPRKNDQPIL